MLHSLPQKSYLTLFAMQAFQNLLNLHILFCPPRDSEVEDPPRTLLSLSLDEEVQLRCAALVQAEIERFAEDVAEHGESADRSSDEGASGDDDAAPKKGARRRNKKALNGTKDAAAPAGTSDIHFIVWTSTVILTIPRRQTNYACPTRTRVCLYGHYLDVPAGYPRWGHPPKS